MKNAMSIITDIMNYSCFFDVLFGHLLDVLISLITYRINCKIRILYNLDT